MELTKWTERKNRKGQSEIILNGGDQSILSVTKVANDIRFMEECDRYYSETYSKEDSLKLIDELREWIMTA